MIIAFAYVGILSIICLCVYCTYFMYENRKYANILQTLKDTYYRIGNCNKYTFTKDEVQDIIGLLHNRYYVSDSYLNKENDLEF